MVQMMLLEASHFLPTCYIPFSCLQHVSVIPGFLLPVKVIRWSSLVTLYRFRMARCLEKIIGHCSTCRGMWILLIHSTVLVFMSSWVKH